MKSKYNLQMILDYIEEKQITRIKDLPSEFQNYLYRTCQYNQLPFYKERQTRDVSKNRLKDWYDIEPILPYLFRWAEQEGTTIYQQAKDAALLPEWKEYCKQHPEYFNM